MQFAEQIIEIQPLGSCAGKQIALRHFQNRQHDIDETRDQKKFEDRNIHCSGFHISAISLCNHKMMSLPAITTADKPHAAFQSRDFRFFQMARLSSVIASEMQAVAVGWQVYEITRSPLTLGYVGLVQFLPSILLFLLAGHTADRIDRRRILLVCQFTFAICSTLLLLYGLHGATSVLPIYAILLLHGTTRAFSGPAGQALMPQLVPVEHFANAVTWGSSTFQVAMVIGPALGGLLYAAMGGPLGVYGLAIGCYLFAVFFTAAVQMRTGRLEKRNVSLETLIAGFRYVWQKKIILGAISLDLFAVLLGGAVALLPVFAKEILDAGPWALGALRSAPAAGAMFIAVIMAFHPLRRRAGVVMFFCVGIFGLSTVFFALSRNLYLSILLLLMAGAADMVSVVVRQTLVQIATPPEMRGRVSAVNLIFIGASNEFGQFESGVTAHWMGTIPATIFGGVGTLLVVVLWWFGFPELRQMEKLTPQT